MILGDLFRWGAPPTVLPTPQVFSIAGPTAAFLAAVRTSHTRAILFQSLDANLQVRTSFAPKVTEGWVSVRRGDEIRRTLTATITDEDGTLVPSQTTDPFWINNIVRVWSGVVYSNGNSEYVPLGTFLMNRPAAAAKAKTIRVEAVDFWKKFQYTAFGQVVSFAPGTTLATIFADLCDRAGVPASQRSIDPTAANILLRGEFPLQFARRAKIADALATFFNAYGWDFWFDPMGTFVARPSVVLEAQPTKWIFNETDPVVTDMSLLMEDSPDISNHVGVSSLSTDLQPVFGEAKDDNQASPTWVGGPFGDRYYEENLEYVQTVAQAADAAKNILRRKLYLAKGVEIPHGPYPHLDVNDIATVTCARLKLAASRHFVDEMDIPLGLDEQRTKLLEARPLP